MMARRESSTGRPPGADRGNVEGTGRLAAFSDGVFAIAITLLVLDLKVPEGSGLWRALARDWPAFGAYVTSFFVIGVMWVNHHAMLAQFVRADRTLFLNLLLAAIAFSVIWGYGVRGGRLLAAPMPADAERRAVVRFGAGTLVYIATVGLAFVSAPLTLGVQFLVALVLLLRSGSDAPGRGPA